MSTFLRNAGHAVRDLWHLAKAKIAAEPAMAVTAGIGSAVTWVAREFHLGLSTDGQAALTTIIVVLVGLAVRGHVSPATRPRPDRSGMPTDEVPES